MPTARANGNFQVVTEVTPGLYTCAQDRAITEGVSLAIVIRKALMHYLNVDATGAPRGIREAE